MTDEEYMAGINACLEPGLPDSVKAINQRVELSTALSLKRIADALTGDGANDLLREIHGSMTNMAWEMGRSFASGQRTDR